MSDKHRKMLSDWQAPYIQALARQIGTQSKETLARWSVGYAERVLLPIWEKHNPNDARPRNALNAAREWISGTLKLPRAKPSILECHKAAREADTNPAAQAAARAIGQCASAIHSAQHCIGLPLYGALAVAFDNLGSEAKWKDLEPCAAEECERMLAALLAVSVPNEPNPARINWQC